MKANEGVWLTTEELAQCEGLTRIAIAAQIRSGKYEKVHKVRGHGGGTKKGEVYLISILDPAVSDRARERFYFRGAVRDVLKTEIRKVCREIRRRCPKRMKLRKILKNLIKDSPI